ncbi:hypothetical protein NA57DRAFT_77446 [Rhizodiscina lignyota]|uniref:Uncharacterized protein n=1 Tax=Rhizodiscina lignyota TaxID=1504668 RepID=A0A9P4ID69_9PEZI|nr:hypothetical protein NA57DRAFT_77446 [Rhizodiscina lignyota]
MDVDTMDAGPVSHTTVSRVEKVLRPLMQIYQALEEDPGVLDYIRTSSIAPPSTTLSQTAEDRQKFHEWCMGNLPTTAMEGNDNARAHREGDNNHPSHTDITPRTSPPRPRILRQRSRPDDPDQLPTLRPNDDPPDYSGTDTPAKKKVKRDHPDNAGGQSNNNAVGFDVAGVAGVAGGDGGDGGDVLDGHEGPGHVGDSQDSLFETRDNGFDGSAGRENDDAEAGDGNLGLNGIPRPIEPGSVNAHGLQTPAKTPGRPPIHAMPRDQEPLPPITPTSPARPPSDPYRSARNRAKSPSDIGLSKQISPLVEAIRRDPGLYSAYKCLLHSQVLSLGGRMLDPDGQVVNTTGANKLPEHMALYNLAKFTCTNNVNTYLDKLRMVLLDLTWYEYYHDKRRESRDENGKTPPGSLLGDLRDEDIDFYISVEGSSGSKDNMLRAINESRKRGQRLWYICRRLCVGALLLLLPSFSPSWLLNLPLRANNIGPQQSERDSTMHPGFEEFVTHFERLGIKEMAEENGANVAAYWLLRVLDPRPEPSSGH